VEPDAGAGGTTNTTSPESGGGEQTVEPDAGAGGN
jgi:hypothetical protein